MRLMQPRPHSFHLAGHAEVAVGSDVEGAAAFVGTLPSIGAPGGDESWMMHDTEGHLQGDKDGMMHDTEGHQLGEATLAQNVSQNASTLVPEALYGPAQYLHCVRASNPVCPTDVCPSMKKCPEVKSSEPTVWGPISWHFLHTMSVNFPLMPNPKHQEGCRKFMEGLPYMLPCGDCGRHLQQTFSEDPGHLIDACSSRDKLAAFVVAIHNDVNSKLGKPQWEVNAAQEQYGSTRMCIRNPEEWASNNPLR